MLMCGLTAMAQDIIVLKDGDLKQVKVIEVGENDVKYKKWENIDGPTYTISISNILSINYQNGAKDSFADYKEKKTDVAQSISEASVNISSSINNKGDKIASNISNFAKRQDIYKRARNFRTWGIIIGGAVLTGGMVGCLRLMDEGAIAVVPAGLGIICSCAVAIPMLKSAAELQEEADLMSCNTLLQYNVNDYFAVNIQEYNFKPNKTRNFGAGVCIRF